MSMRGRPRRVENERSVHRVSFNCTLSEKAVLRALAQLNGVPLHVYVRDLVLAEANDALESRRPNKVASNSGLNSTM